MISLNTDTDPLCFIHVLNIRSSNRSTCNNSLREGGEGREKKRERKREGERKVHVHHAWHFNKSIISSLTLNTFSLFISSLYLNLGLSTGRGLVTESLSL